MRVTDSRVRLAVGNTSLVAYPEAGGLWSLHLQLLAGLVALGHDVLWLEVYHRSGDQDRDRDLVDRFFARMARYRVANHCVVLALPPQAPEWSFDAAAVAGRDRRAVREFIRTADVLWNVAAGIGEPLRSMFRRRALLDGDPGHLQISALDWDMGIDHHEALLTVGGKIHDADCEVPALGRTWHAFPPVVHVPLWRMTADPGPAAPITSVTQWNWGELWLGERVLSISKRDAYMRYADLPAGAKRPFELAANIHPADPMRDADYLRERGWAIVDPHCVTSSPAGFARYIERSRAELCCPKPIFRELRTGWFSDRSAAYLAAGRPVLAEDTGFSDQLPCGRGLLAFRDLAGAAAGLEALEHDYDDHRHAARQLAEDVFGSDRVLPRMVECSLT